MVFQPNHFVDVFRQMPKKIAALHAYESEMRSFPHARSLPAISALEAHRGATVGLRAAEAFELIREIRRRA
jgi:LmbE family N-acetylglucosaminyl deacetylase